MLGGGRAIQKNAHPTVPHVDSAGPRPTYLQSRARTPRRAETQLCLFQHEGTTMRSTITAGGSPDFARTHSVHRFEARRVARGRRCQRREQAPTRSSAEQILARRELRQEQAAGERRERASEAIARRVLVAIRVAMGLVFVACGLSGFLDFTPTPSGQVHPGAMAFGGALLVAGSLLSLLKGTEVIVETVLELQRALGTRRLADRS
jgi:hypothetical protein